MSDRLDGSTQKRKVQAEDEDEERTRRGRKEDNEEAEGTRSAVTLAATLATLKQPPHRYCRAVGQAVAFTTELE